MFRYEQMRELPDPHRYVFLTAPCPWCGGNQKEITVNGEDLFKYNQGTMFVQDAFPYLSAADREQLFISGVCDDCFGAFCDDEEEAVGDYDEQ